MSKVRAFLSYSTKDKRLAGNIKQQLEYWGIGVFLAHEDIRPSRRWQDEIIASLKRCQIFMPLLTKNFTQSEWTDQESGMAIAYSKIIIPLSVNMDIHGFLGRYQALKLKVRTLDESCKKILLVLNENEKLKENLQNDFIYTFVRSSSFFEANDKSELIENLGPYNSNQLNEIIQGCVNNSQIYEAFTARKKVRAFFKKNHKSVKRSLRKDFEKMFS